MMVGLGMWGGGWWMLLFWIVVIALAIWVLRTLFSNTPQRQPMKSPQTSQELARVRYVRGEISREEYFTLLDDLKEDHQS